MKIYFRYTLILLASISQFANAESNLPMLSNTHFQKCLNNLQNSHAFSNISSNSFSNYRPNAPDPSVISAQQYQPEFKLQPWDYLTSLVDEERVQDGITAKNQLKNILPKIEKKYQVKAKDVLAVWGVESNFGKTLGKKDLFQSLATLSCFGSRQSYFRTEYASAIKIVENGDIKLSDMKGSWAGAFGQTQFMPSTFLRLAQDFDGDGRKDLVNSSADALASTANFLKTAGYNINEPWGYEVKLPANYKGISARTNKKDISYWRSQGLKLPNNQPLPDSLHKAGLLLPSGTKGPAFLVGKNFESFYSYNASENYALAIAHLSDLVDRNNLNVSFSIPWPTDDGGLTRRQNREVQQALINLGYDLGQPDGIIGDKTRQAIQDYQRRYKKNPDGRCGTKTYNLLKANNHLNVVAAKENIKKIDINKINNDSKSENLTKRNSWNTGIGIVLLIGIIGYIFYRKKINK